MATRGKKKPTKRKPKAASSNRSLTTFGWIAAGLVGCAWAASDGRPTRYVTQVVDGFGRAAKPELAIDRVAALIENEPKPQRTAAVRPAPPRPRPPAAVEERTGSIRPAPKPAAEIKRSEAAVPLPTKAPLLPLVAPPVEYVLRPARSAPSLPANVPAGEERHATRALAVHQAPDGASPSTSRIASGSSVVVLQSAGDWRYVRHTREGTEGWVDGRFLAGQSMAADLAALTRADIAR